VSQKNAPEEKRENARQVAVADIWLIRKNNTAVLQIGERQYVIPTVWELLRAQGKSQ